ncbi:MAG: hypothetical protein H6818_10675 [Phycisphaerales bacterium]|nr:hypothetical protein [Phycisphaerales bacterium]
MKRVAIDFGTNGIRVAETESPDGRISFHRVDVPLTLAGLATAFEPFADRHGVEVTLRCTNRRFARQSAEFWNAFAAERNCRWFRVLGEPYDTGVTQGVARQLAGEQRLECLAVIDVGDSQASIVVVGHRGELLGRGAWRFFKRNVDRIVAVASSCIHNESELAEIGGVLSPLNVLGIGGAGPDIANAIVERFDGAKRIDHEFSEILPSVGILHADIPLGFERLLPQSPDTRQLRDCFLQMMDDAYDAITREGYDMDDAECDRTVFMQSADGKHEEARSCPMDADPMQLADEFRTVVGMPENTPIHFVGCHVAVWIEPVKPALTGNIVMESL